ncbi:MAG: diguanylate cyclase [Gemmatimonadota bacterium]
MTPRRTVPARVLVLAGAALLVPVGTALLAPEWLASDQGLLIWMTPLLPAFLLAYYRGWRGTAVALAGGMAALTMAHVVILMTGASAPGWGLMLGLVLTYLLFAHAIAALAELLHRARRRAETLAFTDALTGLPNRRRAMDDLWRAFARADRGDALAVILFDVDHFKKINDTHGHAMGDRVLQALGEILKGTTRKMDLSARFGGEEFLTILTGATAYDALEFGQRVRRKVAELDLPCGPFTLSAGISVYVEGTGSPDLLIANADRALYQAKRQGRDRIFLADTGDPRSPGWSGAVAVPDVAPSRARLVPQAGGNRKGPPLIIVLDDDRDVQRSLVDMLTRLGHSALDARDAGHVLELFGHFGDRIELLITDIIMPDMNGLTLVETLHARGHVVRVIYMSGYLRGEVRLPGIPGAAAGFLEKPFEVDTLEATLNPILETAPPLELLS